MLLESFKNKKVTIMGLGLHGGGVEAAKWFVRQGARVTVTDLRRKNLLKPSLYSLKKLPITYILGRHRTEDFESADLVIKNPGVPSASPFLSKARKKHIPIETDLSIFLRNINNRIIGITGTKGKSTTTSLIHSILAISGKKPVMAGNIRISPFKILPLLKSHTPIILELSSWQLEDIRHIKWSPHIAVITNIMPDHLNRYRSMNEYVRAKSLIFAFQGPRDYLIANYDDLIVRKIASNAKSKVVWYSQNDNRRCDVFVRNKIIFTKYGKLIDISKITFPGAINIGNVLASISVSIVLGIGKNKICNALVSFNGVNGRLELVRRLHGIEFINDTTATTPEAALSAISAYPDDIVLIAGGSDKSLNYDNLAKTINVSVSHAFILPGSASDKIIQLLKQRSYSGITEVKSMKQAVRLSYNFAVKNHKKRVVLSPGAASFGLFLNEFDRGDQFIKSVKSLS